MLFFLFLLVWGCLGRGATDHDENGILRPLENTYLFERLDDFDFSAWEDLNVVMLNVIMNR